MIVFSNFYLVIIRVKNVTEVMSAWQRIKVHTAQVLVTRVMKKDNLCQVEI